MTILIKFFQFLNIWSILFLLVLKETLIETLYVFFFFWGGGGGLHVNVMDLVNGFVSL